MSGAVHLGARAVLEWILKPVPNFMYINDPNAIKATIGKLKTVHLLKYIAGSVPLNFPVLSSQGIISDYIASLA